MCEYCGCRDIEIIGRLSEEHYQVVDALGDLRRALESSEQSAIDRALIVIENHLFPHNSCEEAGLFVGLCQREYCEYFGPTVEKLKGEHILMREQVHRIRAGEWDVYEEFEHTLRHHIEQEENGLFPATPVVLDGDTWDMIHELTHEYDHAVGRAHDHWGGTGG